MFYVKVHALSKVALANLLMYSSLYQSQQTWHADQSEQSRLMEGRGLQFTGVYSLEHLTNFINMIINSFLYTFKT